MSRYLREAFFIRPRALGRVPWNLLAVAAIVAGGFFMPVIWYVGGAAEVLYLAAVGGSRRFQRFIDERDRISLDEDNDKSRRRLMLSLGGAARQRYIRIEEKRAKIAAIYAGSGRDEFLFESNRDALRRLTWLYLRLLVAQRNLVVSATPSAEKELRAEIATLETQLAAGGASDTLQRSRQARLELLVQRLENVARREQSLTEIESDLARIEAQMQLALEQASLEDHPVAISTNVDLVSHILDDSLGGTSTFATTSAPAQRETE